MLHTAHLWLFFAMVFGIVLLPGLDMAYVMASSLVGGRRSGLTATAGIVLGGAIHVVMAMLGIVAVLQVLPAAFNLLLLGGAVYIAWIGMTLLRSGASLGAMPTQARRSALATFRQGLVTCLLNPKAYLFMLAVFPQFIKPEYGAMATQAVALGAIIAVTQAAIYGSVALAGERLRRWLATRPSADAWFARSVGAMLLGMAVFTAIEGWKH